MKEGWQEAKNRPDVLLSCNILVENKGKESTNPIYSRHQSRYYYTRIAAAGQPCTIHLGLWVTARTNTA